MDGGEVKTKGLINIDWDSLLSDDDKDEAEPPLLVVVEKTSAAAVLMKRNMPNIHHDDDVDEKAEKFRDLSDKELSDRIVRFKRTLSASLPRDGGEKFRNSIKGIEEELERRKLRNKDGEKCMKVDQYRNLSNSGASDDYRQGTLSSMQKSGSEFATSFLKKMEEKTDHIANNVFRMELPLSNGSDRQRTIPNGNHSSLGRHKGSLSSRQTRIRSCRSLSRKVDKQNRLNGDQKGRRFRTPSPHYFKERQISQVERLDDPRSHHTVVLDDDEEPDVAQTTQEINPIDESLKKAMIYYPSREDPESVEIRYTDLECLAPEAYLSSTIMNVYIRCLQQHRYSTGYDHHFFNTYFYQKLREALSKDDKETAFAKVRRWWKGVNLFEKAYIFIPIHEQSHWSLVIICIPDKEDEIGPIILHLDSLGLHSSELIFENIRRFLIGEWKTLRKGDALPDLPMANKVWDHLPRIIHEKIIEVPTQRNEYDCGLFVLYFIERFIEQAPERLKEEDLAMFGKKWFKPVEASSLRQKIRDLLKEEFKRAKEQNLLLDA